MIVTLDLPPHLSSALEKEASLQNRPVESVVTDALEALYEGEVIQALDDAFTPDDVEELPPH